MILTPVAITFAVVIICLLARPTDDWDGSFVILVLLAAAVIASTWGVYGAALWITGD